MKNNICNKSRWTSKYRRSTLASFSMKCVIDILQIRILNAMMQQFPKCVCKRNCTFPNLSQERATNLSQMGRYKQQQQQQPRTTAQNGSSSNGGKTFHVFTSRGMSTMRKNRKTTQILLIIALCFAIAWLPYHIFMIREWFSDGCRG